MGCVISQVQGTGQRRVAAALLLLLGLACDPWDDPEEAGPAQGTVRWDTIVVGPLAKTNCYLVWAQGSDQAAVIDPGAEVDRILAAARKRGLTIKAIVHTHNHRDHTTGSAALQRQTGAPIHRHPLQDRMSRDMAGFRPAPGVDVRPLQDGDTLTVGGLTLAAVHTPGHSQGSLCLHGEGVLFSGDLLFKGTAGRTDFPGGSRDELLRSLRHRLAQLPDETAVLPGHGGATRLGIERRDSPYFH